jgi:hypothetical protein
MAKHDGPVSVLRAFRKSEIKAILEKQHINRYRIKRKWGFRYLLTAKTD